MSELLIALRNVVSFIVTSQDELFMLFKIFTVHVNDLSFFLLLRVVILKIRNVLTELFTYDTCQTSLLDVSVILSLYFPLVATSGYTGVSGVNV